MGKGKGKGKGGRFTCLTHEGCKSSLKAKHINKTLTCRRELGHGKIECADRGAVCQLLLFHNDDHELNALSLDKPLLVLQGHEYAAETVEEVLEHLLLVGGLWVPGFVHSNRLKQGVNSIDLAEALLIGGAVLQEDGEDLGGVLLVGVELACLEAREKPS